MRALKFGIAINAAFALALSLLFVALEIRRSVALCEAAHRFILNDCERAP